MVRLGAKRFLRCVLVSVVMILYVFTGRKRDHLHRRTVKSPEDDLTSRTLVVLYSNQRSGSSFVGEIFNQNPKSFYLYEPLLPFTTKCKELKQERLDFLKEISLCNFKSVPDSYKNAFAVTKYENLTCLNENICYPDRHKPLLRRYAENCDGAATFEGSSEECGFPLRNDILNELCADADIIAFKILRICSLKMFEEVYDYLTDRRYKVFLIHLVRDPRAILASRLRIKLDGLEEDNLSEASEELCNRVQENLDYVNRASSDLLSNVVSDGRYLRVRYEDIAKDSVKYFEHIYRFLGLTLPPEVKSWISKSQINFDNLLRKNREDVFEMVKRGKIQTKALEPFNSILKKHDDPFQRVRDPSEVVGSWRKSLIFKDVETIQKMCKKPMEKLNYALVSSQEQMNDHKLNLF